MLILKSFNNVIFCFEQIVQAIFVLVVAFIINVSINYFIEKNKDNYFDDEKFNIKYMAHLMACIFSFIFLCISYLVPKEGSGILGFIPLSFFYYSVIKIIMKQNKDNGGYIENLDDASGSIMYITSSLPPNIFLVIYIVALFVCLYFYKRENEYRWRVLMIKRGIDCVLALVTIIIAKVIVPETFICCIWLNVIMISLFTLIIPSINNLIYIKFDLLE